MSKRKFKLIKEYPSIKGLLSKGGVVRQIKTDSGYVYIENDLVFTPDEIEGHPEFWKEITDEPYTEEQ